MIEGLDAKHPKYQDAIYPRKVVRDAMSGSPAIKRAGELYLPIPEGFLLDDTAVSSFQQGYRHLSEQEFDLKDAPWWHPNPAYRSYLQRARYPELVSHTYRGLIGTISRKEGELTLPSKLKYLEEEATQDGRSLFELYVECVAEVLQGGNVDIVVGIDADKNRPYLKAYSSEHRTNWITDGSGLTAINYSFKNFKRKEKSFESEEVATHLVFTLENVDGEPTATMWNVEGGTFGDPIVPQIQGQSLEYLPVVTIGSIKNTPEPQPALLSPIAEIAISIYQKDADLSHAQYMTCNPNLCMTGVSQQEANVPNVVGATVALCVSNPEAKIFYTQTDTSALDHCKGAIQQLFEEALMLGASLLGPGKKGAEAADTVKARQNDKSATLVSVVDNVAEGINDALEICAQLMGIDPGKVEYVGNTDFAEFLISPQMLSALRDLWMAAGLSKESLIHLIKRANLLPPDVSVEDELTRIETEGPLSENEDNVDDKDKKDDEEQ